MKTGCDWKEADWDSLALGCLESHEAESMLAHLRTCCQVCGPLYAESLLACQAMATSLAGQAPGQTVEDRLEAYVKPKRSALFLVQAHKATPWLLAAASLAFAFWMGIRQIEPVKHVVVEPGKVETRVVDPNPELERRIAELQSRPVEGPRVVEKVLSDPRVAELEARLAEAERKLALKPESVAPSAPAAPSVVRVVDEERVKKLEALLAEAQNAHREDARASQQRTQHLQMRMAGLEATIADYRNAFRTIESDGMKQVELARVDAAAQRSAARALYSKQGGLLVVAHDLPQLPAQKCYQVWILRKGSPSIVSGGLMKLDASGHGVLQSPPTAALADATGFAITDEPEGGSVVARGRKLLFGAL
ncbi:MAG: hypothetical protein FJW36_11405 [Acidobacteria bacterium]|nr:hypothetical protein [Acidobacteriota bacterium]